MQGRSWWELEVHTPSCYTALLQPLSSLTSITPPSSTQTGLGLEAGDSTAAVQGKSVVTTQGYIAEPKGVVAIAEIPCTKRAHPHTTIVPG